MIKNMKWLLALLFLPLLAACSWEDMPAYEEAEITGVQFRYRWYDNNDKDAITGEAKVKEYQLNTTTTINSEAGTVTCVVTVPAANNNFPADVRDKVTTNPLWGQVTLSTAARIFPTGDTKALGTPGDWSKPNTFKVQAANGTVKMWTITVTTLNK